MHVRVCINMDTSMVIFVKRKTNNLYLNELPPEVGTYKAMVEF